MNAVLSLVEVSKDYVARGRRVEVLRDVSIDLRPGELTWLAGESGSGKSSLIRVAGLLASPSSGTVQLQGAAVQCASAAADRARREAIGLIFQSENLLADLTLTENLKVAHAGADTSTIEAVLAELGLADVAHSQAKKVSGGQAQRAAVGRALLRRPAVVLADEPTSGLDGTNAQLIRDLLRRAADQGTAVLVASHDPATAGVADGTITMKGGQRV